MVHGDFQYLQICFWHSVWCRMSQKFDAWTGLCSSSHWLGVFSVAFRYSWLTWLQVTMALKCARIEWDMMKVRLIQLHPEIYNMTITYSSPYSVFLQLVLGRVKVKLSLFWIKHHGMKTFWGVEVWLHTYWTSAPSRCSCFASWKETDRTHCIGANGFKSWFGRCGGENISCKILVFHGGDYEECRLLGCGVVLILYEATFRRNLSPPSSELKNPRARNQLEQVAAVCRL
jgi:hypothetical protein